MLLFKYVAQYEPSVIAGKASALSHQVHSLYAASGLSGLQKQMCLGIVSQGLKMSHSLHTVRNGLLIYHAGISELYLYSVALLYEIGKDLVLHIPHEPYMYLII